MQKIWELKRNHARLPELQKIAESSGKGEEVWCSQE